MFAFQLILDCPVGKMLSTCATQYERIVFFCQEIIMILSFFMIWSLKRMAGIQAF